MIAVRTHRLWMILGITIAALVLGFATTATWHAARLFVRQAPYPAGPASCAAPALPGTTVDITATDMGALMGPGMRGPGMMGSGGMGPGMMWPGARASYPANPGAGYPWPGMGMMRLLVNPSSVPAGAVSLRVTNTGAMPHEVVVLPIPTGQAPGQRISGPDGKIDESGSLGEAALTCGNGDGEGIAAGATGWTTVALTPGRYELVCNIAGHYAWGMYAELDVVGQPT